MRKADADVQGRGLTSFSGQNGEMDRLAQELARAREEIDEQARAIGALSSIATVIASGQDVAAILQAVTDLATALVRAQFGACITHQSSGEHDVAAVSGSLRDDAGKTGPDAPAILLAARLRGAQVVRAADITQSSNLKVADKPVRSYLAVPIASPGGSVYGSLLFGHEVPAVFTQQHELLVQAIAVQVAIAIDSARLREAEQLAQQQLREMNDTLEQRVEERTRALHRSELQFQQLVAGVADYAIYMLDPNGNVVSWNPGAERIKGYTAAEIVGRNFQEFYTPEDRAIAKPAHALATAAAHGKYEAEAWRVRKDGTRFWANVLIDAIRDPQGQLIGFAKVTRDMTEKRAMQEQLHQSQKMEAIGQLTGGVAHDFNNLLTVILGNLDSIGRRVPEDNLRLRRSVEQATQGAERAATLTQQLLAFARRQPLNPKPTDVNRLITGMADLAARTLRENIHIEHILAPDLRHVEIDAHQLESALLNLAVNARDAMPQGGRLTIETSNVIIDERSLARSDMKSGDYVLICVTDTGCGMTPQVLSRAFDPFFTTKAVGEGTGLGLSQVFGFVTQSGGYVRLHSEVGHGTTVRLYLPALDVDVPAVDVPEPITEVRARDGETILVVEDEDDVRIYTTETLRELGFTVLEAHDGASALTVLEHHPEVRLLFTDVGLPGINGRELVEAARQRRPELRVLFVSGYERNALMHDGRLDPGVDLLSKPFTRAHLASRVRASLDSVLA